VEPFENLVQRHGEAVMRVCRGLLGPHDAEDAWAETFLTALRAHPLEGVRDERAWLLTVAHRRAVDLVRSRSRTVPVAEPPETVAAERADARDLDLWAALARLTERQRAAVVHHHLGGLGYREIAEMLGGTPSAARRAAADGVAALRRMLGAEGGGR